MYEMGFYLAFHLGCKNVTTYGWDNNLKGSSHFYKKIAIKNFHVKESNLAKSIESPIISFFKDRGMVINIKR